MRFLLKNWLPPEFLRDEGEFLDPKETVADPSRAPWTRLWDCLFLYDVPVCLPGGMESQLQLMSDYSLQLRTDTTLLRLSNMHDETDANYVLAAYRMMQSLTIRQYGLISLPVIRSTLYLKESNHILTSSESVPAELYSAPASTKIGLRQWKVRPPNRRLLITGSFPDEAASWRS